MHEKSTRFSLWQKKIFSMISCNWHLFPGSRLVHESITTHLKRKSIYLHVQPLSLMSATARLHITAYASALDWFTIKAHQFLLHPKSIQLFPTHFNYFSTWALFISSLWAIGNITFFPTIITHLLLCYSSIIITIFSFPISYTILNWTFSLLLPFA